MGDITLDNKESSKLNWAGDSYVIGDIALWLAGEFGGAWWLAGGLAAARYGNPGAEKQFELLSRRLGNHLRRNNVEIPENPTTESLRKKGGVLDHIESFMYAYPSQILNTAYTIGSLLLIKSGLFPKAGQPPSYARAGAGVLVIAGALGGLLIKEKKPDPEHPPEGLFGKIKAWFEERPLRWPAIAYAFNDVLLAKDALNDMRNPAKGKWASYLKWLTVAAYAFGNVMLALSNKSNAGSAASVLALEHVADTAALVIAGQKPEIQEMLMKEIPQYLASQPEANITADEIEKMLRDKLAEMSKKPENSMDWQQRMHLPKLTQPTPSL